MATDLSHSLSCIALVSLTLFTKVKVKVKSLSEGARCGEHDVGSASMSMIRTALCGNLGTHNMKAFRVFRKHSGAEKKKASSRGLGAWADDFLAFMFLDRCGSHEHRVRSQQRSARLDRENSSAAKPCSSAEHVDP